MRRAHSAFSVIAVLALVGLGATVASGCKKGGDKAGDGKATADAQSGGAGTGSTPPASAKTWQETKIPGLFETPFPADNPMTADKITLGAQLFFDKRLSANGLVACEGCHFHDKGWTDALPFSTKVGGELNTRNTPTLYNVGYQQAWYWDGRAPTLEKQIAAAWEKQMGANRNEIATLLAGVPAYADAFQKVFGGPPSEDNIVLALAAFLRTLRSGGSPWDRYENKEQVKLPEAAVAGYQIFAGKGQCIVCHMPPLYTDGKFHNIGLEAGKEKPDPGRAKVTNDVKDTGAFKTPSLRSVAKTGPYFHDASAKTLADAVRFMAIGGKEDPNRDPLLKNVGLTDEEIAQVTAFLETLSSNEPRPTVTVP
jgi:cytochrome c peroxidase